MNKLNILLKKFRKIEALYMRSKEVLAVSYYCNDCKVYHTYAFNVDSPMYNQVLKEKRFFVEKTYCKNPVEGDPYLIQLKQELLPTQKVVEHVTKLTENFLPKGDQYIPAYMEALYQPKIVTEKSIKKALEEIEMKELLTKIFSEISHSLKDLETAIAQNLTLPKRQEIIFEIARLSGQLDVLWELSDRETKIAPDIMDFLIEKSKEVKFSIKTLAYATEVSLKSDTNAEKIEEKVLKMFKKFINDY